VTTVGRHAVAWPHAATARLRRCGVTTNGRHLPPLQGRWPGQSNTLDAVLARLQIRHQRGLHGALKDAHLLAQVIPHLR